MKRFILTRHNLSSTFMSMNFGKTIKDIRLERQETLHQLSMGTDIDMTLLSKFERDVRFPTDDQLKRISNYLGIPEFYSGVARTTTLSFRIAYIGVPG